MRFVPSDNWLMSCAIGIEDNKSIESFDKESIEILLV
jgi:hypothetical protein